MQKESIAHRLAGSAPPIFNSIKGVSAMTDRDLFALAAMNAFLTNSTCLNYVDDKYGQCFMLAVEQGQGTKIGLEDARGEEYRWSRYWADQAYQMADEMVRQGKR
jgi:hypothetical protein